jgi:preprotein translocase subunit YajC
VHGDSAIGKDSGLPEVPDDASALTSDDDRAEDAKVDFAKSEGGDSEDAGVKETAEGDDQPEDAKRKGTDSE